VIIRVAGNFVRVHETLRATPVMAANVTKRLWEQASRSAQRIDLPKKCESPGASCRSALPPRSPGSLVWFGAGFWLNNGQPGSKYSLGYLFLLPFKRILLAI
jgi:hypothetical protein